MNTEKEDEEEITHENRSTAAQVIAALSSGIMMFNIALIYTIITIVNGSITEVQSSDAGKSLRITKNEASWYASIIHLTHLIGSIIAGFLQDSFGRRKCMLFCIIPQVMGWITLFYANEAFYLYISSILMGFGVSIGEVPVGSYVSETARPKLRGRLFAFLKLGYGFGALFVYFLSNYFKWRTLALICMIGPIVGFCYLLVLPETPSWLLANGKRTDALKSLQWLRGWVSADVVSEEFRKLERYIRQSKKLGEKVDTYVPVLANNLEVRNQEKSHEVWNNIKILGKKEFLHPYKIVAVLYLLSYVLSLRVVKPYLVPILKRFQINASKILAVSSFFQILGALTMAISINRFGKRKLITTTFNISALCLMIFGMYSLMYSYHYLEANWILYGMFATIFYLTGYTLGGMPWFICSEIYPQQIRGVASGVSAMSAHLMLFVLVNLYVKLEIFLGVPNMFFLYGVVGIIGTFYLHTQLPETENKSLEEIEESLQKKNNNRFDTFTA